MDLALLAIGVGLGIGVVVGALGAGGGILAVPVLVYLLGMRPADAAASSLVIMGITALVSLRHHGRAGNVAWRDGVVFGLVSVLGAVAGSRVSVLVPPRVLMGLFGALLLVVAVTMLRKGLATRRTERRLAEAETARTDPGEGADDAAGDEASADAPTVTGSVAAAPHHGPSVLGVAGAATFTGLITGFFGVGGGFVVVPMLVLALGLAMRRASGTSLLVMVIVSATSLLARIGTDVHLDWPTTLLFAASSSVGGLIGGPVSARMRPSTLTLVFSGLLAVVAAVTLLSTLLR
ncbi:sulfite exporter TauE/SafE family protein [Brachybacterium sp. EF45031]|uniref:sulfite exporter TauE/SafE family protein n=1 Tax=Brachybacterium sillae TaxID=2810536 RepID=UPI00217DCE36|nr:sulfite exporter TauE/SafE family protein [Brachybacterium sillae]MCS6711917.1 sulfite exporter TauE/SafE family protein [Brachybacterium sillae]